MELTNSNRFFTTFFLCAIIIVLAYSNSFNAAWQLDDMHNITNNQKIQITELSLQSIKGSFFSNMENSKSLYRPLSCFSFALNAYLGGTSPTGYHIVNLTIHIATALLLAYFMKLMFMTPSLCETSLEKQFFIITVSTLLWSLNPIQTQTVTYIVQRMTELSAFFTLIALVFFLKARMTIGGFKKIAYYSLVLIGIIFSLLSKENGIVAPLLIMIINYVLFKESLSDVWKNTYFLWGVIGFIILSATACFVLGFNPLSLLNYSNRTFTLYERSLTQPRILLFYLSQIFYPLPQRLSIEHDIVISTDFFSPLDTSVCIAAIIFIFLGALFSIRMNTLTKISILFYFVGHSIESTILPLEMAFEHRNYLPSMLLFIPISELLFNLLTKYKKQTYMKTSLIVFITSIIFLFSFCTFIRNKDWYSSSSLVFDALAKAPNAARPKQTAGYLYDITGNQNKALEMYQKALNSYAHTKSYKSATYLNIGIILTERKDYQNAIESLDTAIKINPKLKSAYYAKAQAFIGEAKWDKAIGTLESASQKWPEDADVYELSGICHLNTGNYNSAIKKFREALSVDKESISILLNTGECLSLMGYSERADFFFKRASAKKPTAPEPYLWAAKNHFLNGDTIGASAFIRQFFLLAGAENSKPKLDELRNNRNAAIIGMEKMDDFLKLSFDEYKKSI